LVWCRQCGRDNPVGSQFCAICGSSLAPDLYIQPRPASRPETHAVAIIIIVLGVVLSLGVIAFMDYARTESNPPVYNPPSSNPPPSQNTPPPTQEQKWSSVGVTVENWDQSVTFSFSIYIDGKYESTSQIRPSQALFSSYDVYWSGTYFHNTTVELRCSAGNQIKYVEVAENTIGASVEFKINAPVWAEPWS